MVWRCREFFFKYFRFFHFSTIFFRTLFFGSFFILRHRTLCPEDCPDPPGPPHTPTPAPPQTPPGCLLGKGRERAFLEGRRHLGTFWKLVLDYPTQPRLPLAHAGSADFSLMIINFCLISLDFPGFWPVLAWSDLNWLDLTWLDLTRLDVISLDLTWSHLDWLVLT